MATPEVLALLEDPTIKDVLDTFDSGDSPGVILKCVLGKTSRARCLAGYLCDGLPVEKALRKILDDPTAYLNTPGT